MMYLLHLALGHHRCIECGVTVWPWTQGSCEIQDDRWVCSRRCWETVAAAYEMGVGEVVYG